MTTSAHIAEDPNYTSNRISRLTQQVSLRLATAAAGIVAVGIGTGYLAFLHRSPMREAHVPGSSAWPEQLITAVAACVLYAVARRRRRRFGRNNGRLLLLAPLGKSAATRLMATTRQASWRSVVALPLLALIGYNFWRCGWQVTNGLDPNFTVNAWGGPTYLGAMACHYLDGALLIAASARLLDKILLPIGAAS
jgi:hypothetical protein